MKPRTQVHSRVSMGLAGCSCQCKLSIGCCTFRTLAKFLAKPPGKVRFCIGRGRVSVLYSFIAATKNLAEKFLIERFPHTRSPTGQLMSHNERMTDFSFFSPPFSAKGHSEFSRQYQKNYGLLFLLGLFWLSLFSSILGPNFLATTDFYCICSRSRFIIT